MSFCTRPTVAAKKAVIAPTKMTTESAVCDSSKIGESRATMKTPAVTMVAAWISAETGVGPSMASGSQVWSGTCADFPIAPMKRSRQTTVIAPCAVVGLAEDGERDLLAFGDRRGIGEDRVEVDRGEEEEDAEDAEREAEIADAVDDEGLDRGGVRRRAVIPEADQQVGGEADALPAEEHLHEVVGRHQHQHGEGEERQIGEEARPVRVVRHVADRVDVDERRHGVHDDQHHDGQRVDAERPVGDERAGMDPGEDRDGEGLALAEADLEERDPGQDRRDDEQPRRDQLRRARALRRRVMVVPVRLVMRLVDVRAACARMAMAA